MESRPNFSPMNICSSNSRTGSSVAYSPEPGKRAVFDTTWLYKVARGYGLAWKPLSNKQQAVVRRESIAIKRAEIEDNILGALIEQGTSPEMSVELSNRMLQIHVPSDTEATIAVEDLLVDQRTSRFTAWLTAPANGPVSSRTRVTGQIVKMVDVPVLNNRIARDQIIRAEDLKWIKIRSKRIQDDVVTNANGLIGMTPKRVLRSGKPVSNSDISRPLLIKKGGLVTMVLKSPFMTLTSQGRALDNGSDGDVVRITNTQSNKTVQAVVTNTGQVRVTSASSLAMN
jgi:flagellar basal body P-ring formation protein FlgA